MTALGGLLIAAPEALDQRRLTAANTQSVLGQLKLTERQYTAAAQAFREAANLVPPGHDDQRLTYLDREALALYDQGDERSDNVTLRAVVRTDPSCASSS